MCVKESERSYIHKALGGGGGGEWKWIGCV